MLVIKQTFRHKDSLIITYFTVGFIIRNCMKSSNFVSLLFVSLVLSAYELQSCGTPCILNKKTAEQEIKP